MPIPKPLPPLEELRSWYIYADGVLVSRRYNRPIVSKQVRFEGDWLLTARVLWKMATGADPVELLDHRNGDPLANHIDNIREATHRQNSQNRKARKDSVSGLKGVSYRPARKYCRERWVAMIWIDGVCTHLGAFDSAEEAHAVYRSAELKHFGAFAREQPPG